MSKVHPLAIKTLLVGVPLLVGIAMLPTDPQFSAKRKPNRSVLLKNNGNIYGSDKEGMARSGQQGEFRPVQIPAEFVHGSKDWTFSGTATVEGKPRALIANTTTGETVFLSVGQSWQGMRLQSVDENAIVISGTDGKTPTISLRGNGLEATKPVDITTNNSLLRGRLVPHEAPTHITANQ